MEKIADIIRYCGTREEVSKRCLKRRNRIGAAATSPVFITFDKKKRKLGCKVYGNGGTIVCFFFHTCNNMLQMVLGI